MKLFWLLCAWLLLAGTVEAGDEIGEDRWWHHINPPKSMLGTTGNELFLCDIGKPCKASYEAVGCYQRMREAMRAMEPFISGERHIARPMSEAEQDRYFRDKSRVYVQWDRVMRECIQ